MVARPKCATFYVWCNAPLDDRSMQTTFTLALALALAIALALALAIGLALALALEVALALAEGYILVVPN